jgi:hypothetical protein
MEWKKRTCVIDKDGKEVEYNVNRLTKQYEWDADHPDTSGVMEQKTDARAQAKLTRKTEDIALEVGHMVIFHKALARGHRSPFGVAKVLDIREDGTIHYQWYGNYYYNANGAFQPGWKNLREDLGYYKIGKVSRLDVPWTGEHTEEILTRDLIIISGDDLLGKDKKLSARARKAIATSVGEQETWQQVQ